MTAVAERLLDLTGHPKTLAVVFTSLLVAIFGIFWTPLLFALVVCGAYALLVFVTVLLMFWTEEA